MGRSWQVVLFSALVVLPASAARPDGFQVVVHPTVEGTEISRSVLADIYKKDIIRWGDQVRIQPVDQSSETSVRQAFLRDVLGQSFGEVQGFWRQRMATDRQVPPPTRASDEEVLAFVASKKGAIGYVSAAVEVLDDVKVLILVD
jgi:ABC-type phosphate transport system substrate-binding protein